MNSSSAGDSEQLTTRPDEFVLPDSLSAREPVAGSAFDLRLREVALTFQRVGLDSAFSEMQGIVNGIGQDRTTELIGRIASTGEQLALAGAAFRDMRAWQVQNGVNAAASGRALAEVVAYFAYGAAHGLINATARLFAMESRSRETFSKQAKGRYSNEGFPPFGTKAAHWLSFNASNIKSIEQATQHHPEASGLIEVLRELETNAAWGAMVDRRHNDFHRWRPQSSSVGVAPETQWQDAGNGVQSLVIYESNVYAPEPAETYATEATHGLDALTHAMESWIALYPTTIEQIRIFTLAAKFGEEL